MTLPVVQLIVGTTRRDRFSEKPLEWLVDRLARRDDLEFEILDLRDHPLPLYDLTVAPARGGRNYENEEVARLGAAVDRADAYIVVTGEYNHGYPASLKNAMDNIFPEFSRKPIAFVGYGQVGGARAIEQLRLVAVEFEMAPVRFAIHILPDLLIAARQADVFSPELFGSLDQRLAVMVDDLLWWTNALAAARAAPRVTSA